MKRTDFLQKMAVGTAGLLTIPKLGLGAMTDEPPAAYKAEVVREFVGAGHKDLGKVQTILKEFPNILYSAHDWGNGDFETALEAAGHVGNKEIAQFLLGEGARPNLFVLTMLGKTHLVKPILEEYPALIFSKGPHGYTLLHHAQRGGEEAKELLEFVHSKGLKETRINLK